MHQKSGGGSEQLGSDLTQDKINFTHTHTHTLCDITDGGVVTLSSPLSSDGH